METDVFHYIFSKFGSVLSNSVSSSCQKEFWRARMLEGSDRGFPVGIMNFNTDEISWKLANDDFEHWIQDVNKKWDWEKSNFRFIIKMVLGR